MTVPDSTPIIIGVGQVSERPDQPGYSARSPMDLAGDALVAAIGDAQAIGGLAAAIDTIAAIRQFEISMPRAVAPFGKSDNPPRSIAQRAGANPARAILEVVGGQGPQKLVGELAADIAAGRCQVAAIVGSEAISTALAAAKKDIPVDWSETVGGELEDRGYGMKGLIDRTLIAHAAGAPIPGYALMENARRARLSLSLDDYRLKIGSLFAPFTAVAASNPHAAAPVVRGAEQLAAVTIQNRIVAEPYTRMTVARDQVNQAAAIILASAGAARALGVPEQRWVHIHAVTSSKEASVLGRADLAQSPASVASVAQALAIAGIEMDAISFIDLYSCFAIPVFNICDAFNLAADDPRGLTVTGGLPFFGGAGNNYSAHAIVEVVSRLRSRPDAYGLVGANGGVMSKYATGIYSHHPADWTEHNRFVELPGVPQAVEIAEAFEGEGTVETYTLLPGQEHPLAVIVARADSGARAVANLGPDDVDGLRVISDGQPFGRRVSIRPASNNRNECTFL
jgi:acetyl-CoA C-acetyltransferase